MIRGLFYVVRLVLSPAAAIVITLVLLHLIATFKS